MPHKDAVTSDSESERQHTGSAHKKYSAKKARRSSSDVADMSDVEEMKSAEDPSEGAAQGDEGEEEGEEYEIELILDAKKGQFSGVSRNVFQRWPWQLTPRKWHSRAGWGTSSNGRTMARNTIAG